MTKRLYDLFKPAHYDIYLDISRERKTFKGKVTIKGCAIEKNFKLNQKYLTIEEVKVDGKNTQFKEVIADEAILIESEKSGDVEVTITFSGPLTDPMMGIYPSYYQVDGVKKQLVSTQFETTFARQAFPCVDEPAAKATFSLAIKFDEKEGETIIANQPEIKCENGVHYFEETVKMSTYLLAFAFGDLQKKLTKTKSGINIGVFATKAHKDNELDFALDIAKRCIEFFEDFYDTPYPLSQSYHIALPDFSAGAMENWGLITYRESCLLLDPNNSSLPTKQYVASVIAHELAHQWFGDLVTMQWWDDLWLNESFANMMEYVAVDALEKDFKIWENFHTSDVPAALRRDATDGVQPVHVAVNNPAEIDSIFDSAIVYAKGARMLVMVRALLGDENLRKGLKAYFKAHQYNNSVGDDLWSALEEASGLKIKDIMHTWLKQPGYPVVSANIVNGDLLLEQKQFFIGENKPQNRLWQIPLNSNYESVTNIMNTPTLNLGNYEKLRQANKVAFRLNVGNNSHFIINYEESLLKDIINDIANLDNIDKLQLLQDLSLLAQAKEISYSTILPLMQSLATSDSQIVHSKISSLTATLKSFVKEGSEEEKEFKTFVNSLVEPKVNELGPVSKSGDNNDQRLTRPTIYAQAIYADNKKASEQLHSIYLKNENDTYNLAADMRDLILQNEIKNYNNLELFNKLLDAYRKHSDAEYKEAIGFALCSSKNHASLKELLTLFKDAETIKPQDLRGWYAGLLRNSVSRTDTWHWLQNEWSWLEKTVGGDMEFSSFITVTAYSFFTREELKEFKDFFLPKLNTPGLTREIEMGIKVISSKVDLIEHEKESLTKALKELNKIQ